MRLSSGILFQKYLIIGIINDDIGANLRFRTELIIIARLEYGADYNISLSVICHLLYTHANRGVVDLL